MATPAPILPLPRPATIQHDLFCSCGYNLCSQRVEVDERLSIPVCRCPECGRFHALTTTTPVQSSGRARWELLMVVTYVLAMLSLLGMGTIGIVMLQYAFVNISFDTHQVQNMGRMSRLARIDQLIVEWAPALVALAAAGGSFIYVCLFTTFFWHWWRKAYAVLLLAPLLGAVLLYWLAVLSREREFFHENTGQWILVVVAVELAGMAAGLRWGRMCVRGLLRLMLPGRWRQVVSFLWIVDGIPMPGVETSKVGPTPPSANPVNLEAR